MPLPSGGASNFFAQYYYTKTELNAGQLDTLYFGEDEFINTSAGAGDAGKPIKLDASGLIASSMMSGGTVATHAALTAAHGATGAVVGTTNTQTLTNKILTAPGMTTPSVTGAAAKLTVNASSSNPSVAFAAASVDEYGLYYNVASAYFAVSETGVGDHIVVKNGGNVGINNTNPGVALDVTGTMNASTGITINSVAVPTISSTSTLTNKTLTTPTIVATGFSNMNHTHAGATTGGQIAHTALTSIGTNTHATIDTLLGDASTHYTATTGIHGVGAGAIVGTTNTQTLTNKTIDGGTVNATALQQGGVQAVTTTGTQTLTNKTLTSPSLTTPSVTGASAKMTINASSGSPAMAFTENGTEQYGLYYNVTSDYFSISETGVADHFVIKDGGNVGVGTATPDYKFEVELSNYTMGFAPNFSGGNNYLVSTLSGSLNPMVLYGSKIIVGADHINISASKTPASAGATGAAGDIAFDASYIYVCTATNTWKRVAIATW